MEQQLLRFDAIKSFAEDSMSTGENKLSGARLVKRKDRPQQEPSTESIESPSSSEPSIFVTVMNWKNERSRQRQTAREQFAALFAQPQVE
ncbi:MAG TPA: hypothetical protein VNO70_05475 [Blastocatellia bacterium]|nr:hypothetical protein [Blastocatellia bacterium]